MGKGTTKQQPAPNPAAPAASMDATMLSPILSMLSPTSFTPAQGAASSATPAKANNAHLSDITSLIAGMMRQYRF